MGRIKELRRSRGLTQEGLANEIGTSQQTISRIENNEDMIPTDLLIKLARFYNVSADYIMSLTDEKYNRTGGDRMMQYVETYSEDFTLYDSLSPENKEVVKAVIGTLTRLQEENGRTPAEEESDQSKRRKHSAKKS